MCVTDCHRDRVRIEIEAYSVASFRGRSVVDHNQGVVVVDERLKSQAAHECCAWAGTQVAAVNQAGAPGGKIATFEPIGKYKIARARGGAWCWRVRQGGGRGCGPSGRGGRPNLGERGGSRRTTRRGYGGGYALVRVAVAVGVLVWVGVGVRVALPPGVLVLDGVGEGPKVAVGVGSGGLSTAFRAAAASAMPLPHVEEVQLLPAGKARAVL